MVELDENGCECDIEFAPGDVPVIDNVRPLDRKPFARSVTKFMKVSPGYLANIIGKAFACGSAKVGPASRLAASRTCSPRVSRCCPIPGRKRKQPSRPLSIFGGFRPVKKDSFDVVEAAHNVVENILFLRGTFSHSKIEFIWDEKIFGNLIGARGGREDCGIERLALFRFRLAVAPVSHEIPIFR